MASSTVGRSMADFAATWDRLAIDGLTTKAPRFLAAGFGHALRLLHTGRPQWQAAAAVMGLVLMGWYILSPHANATVDARGLTGPHSTRGTVRFEAAPGHGYRYRWHVEGQPPPKQFTTKRTFSFVLQRCEQKTAVLTVKPSADATAWFGRESRPGCCRNSAEPPKPARAQNERRP